MAVQYNSKDNSWSGLGVEIAKSIKNKATGNLDISDDIKKNLETLKDLQGTTGAAGDLKSLFSDIDEDFSKFLNDVDMSGDVFKQYQAHMKKNQESTSLFSRATKTATTVAKKFVATLGSMAATFLVSEGISLIISGISKVKDLIKEEKNATANIINDNYEQAANSIKVHSEAVSQTEERIEKLEDLRSKLDNAKDSEEDFYALSDEIYDATGYWVSGVKNISDAYDTVTKKIDESIKKSKEFEEYHKTREHEELKNKLENSSITSEDEDGNKIAYNFSETANNPNYINDLKIKFGKKTNNFESIQKIVEDYLSKKQLNNEDVQLSSQDLIDVYAKILNKSSDISKILGEVEIDEISNKYGEDVTDNLPSEEDFKKSVNDTINDYLEYYKDIISKSEFFTEDEFKEIISNAYLSGNITNIDDFGKTLEELSKIKSNDIDKEFNELWDKYYSSSLDEQESIKNEIIDKYTEFLKQNNLNNDFLDNFLSNVYFNSEISDKDTFLKNSFSEKAEARLKEAEQNLKDEYKKISDFGLDDYADQIKNDTIQTQFGNVDMDKRTIIHWSKEIYDTIQKTGQTYKEALETWGYDPLSEGVDIDTVWGASDRFGEDLNDVGWEVAFTPILPDGTFLSKDTVTKYINSILKDAYADDGKVTNDELKELDAKGKTIGNTVVKGIYAGIDDSQNYDDNGNLADVIGRLMHFSGKDGAVQLAKQEIHKLKEQLGKFSLSSLSFEEIFSKEDEDADDKNLNSLKKRFANYKTEISEISEYLNTLYDNNADSKTISEIVEKYGLVGDSVKDYINQLEKLQETDKSSILKEIDDDISECDESLNKDTIEKLTTLKQVVEDFFTDNVSKKSEIQKVKEELEELEDTQNKVKKGYVFSTEEMATLIDKYPELKKAVIECKNGYKIEAETLKDVMNTSKETANSIISDEIRKTNEIIRSTQANISAYEAQLVAYETLIAGMNQFYLTHADPESKHSDNTDVFADKYEIEDKIDKSKEKLKGYTDDLKELEKLYSQTISTSGEDKKNKSDSKTEKSIEVFDFIEIKIKRIESIISKLKTKAEDTTKSLSSRIKSYSSAISKTTTEINIQSKAYDKYMSRANKVARNNKLSNTLIQRVQEGSFNIKDYSSDTAKKIKDYQEWYEKAIACKDAIDELTKSQKELLRNKYQLYIDNYKSAYDDIGNRIDSINNKISLKESSNQLASKSDYNSIDNYYSKQIKYLDLQNTYLVKQQSTVKKNSQEWKSYKTTIDSNNSSIQNITKSIIENANALAELNKQKADKKIEKYDSVDELYNAKIDNAISEKVKNSLIDKEIGNILQRKLALNQSVTNDTAGLKQAKSDINKTKYSGFKSSILSQVKRYIQSNKPIPTNIIETVTTWDNGIFARKCARYNAYLNALEVDKQAVKLYEETSKKDKADKIQQKFNNISDSYQRKLDIYSQRGQQISDAMELAEAKGYKDSINYYKKSQQEEINTNNELLAKRSKLINELAKNVENGNVTKYDDNWITMTNNIDEVTNAIAQSNKQLEEFKNNIRELTWNRFDDLQSAFKDFTSESDFMIKELSRKDLADDETGKLTENGNAVMALHKSNYEVYSKSAKDYANEITEINKDLVKDSANTKLIDRKKELVSAYQEAISAAQDEKYAIIDLTKQGYTALENKIKDLIDQYLKLLDAEKSAYDYSNNISDKTQKIAQLRKQLEVYSNDMSEEAKSKIQSISVSLKDAEKDLEQTQYDKYISDTKDMLSDLQDALSDSIDKITKAMDDNFKSLKIDVKDAAKTIADTSKSIGYQSTSDFTKLTNGFVKNDSIEKSTNSVVNSITSYQTKINSIADNVAKLVDSKTSDEKISDKIQQDKTSTKIQQDAINKFLNSNMHTKAKTTKVENMADINKTLYKQYGKVLTLKQWQELGRSIGVDVKNRKDLTKSGALYKKLHSLGIKGFSVGSHRIDKNQLALLGEEGVELQFDKSQGVLRTIGEGDKIFTNEMTENLWKLAKQNPISFDGINLVPKIPTLSNNSSNVSIDIGNITLPSVTKPEEFAKALKDTINSNSSVQKQIKELGIGGLNKNTNSLGIRRF